MIRNRTRITPGIEGLEKREVLSSGGPTEQAQYMLEVLNLVRTNPTEGASWVREHVDPTIQANLTYYGVNIDDAARAIASAKPQQPLAWDARLASSAQQHSDDMAAKGYQSHEQPNPETRTIEQRMDRSGYTNRTSFGENAFAYARGPRDVNSEKAVDNALQAFLIDWGVPGEPHRKNILEPDKNDNNSSADVGLGIADVTSRELLDRGFGPKVVTQVFGRESASKAQIVGVVYEDTDRDGRFSFQEGRGDVSIVIEDLNGRNTRSLATWNSGGYQAEVDPGTYRVQAVAAGKKVGSQVVQVGSTNVKVDFKLGQDAATVTTAPTRAITTAPAPVRTVSQPVATPAPRVVPTVSRMSFSAPKRVDSTPRLHPPKKAEPAPVVVVKTVVNPPQATRLPVDDGYAVAVNITAKPVEAAPVVAVTTPPVVDEPVSDQGQELVDEVLGSGLLAKWSSSRIVWGQGWKASEDAN